MSTQKWIAGAGQGLTWGDAFGTAKLDSIANGSSILSDVAITNGTALDMFADISIAFGSITVAAPARGNFYIYPLNKDGSTYGDSRFGSAAAGIPPDNYFVGSIGAPTGAAAITGALRGILLPAGTFKFVFLNMFGNTLVGSSGNTCQYRTYNISTS